MSYLIGLYRMRTGSHSKGVDTGGWDQREDIFRCYQLQFSFQATVERAQHCLSKVTIAISSICLRKYQGIKDRRQPLKRANHCFPFDKGTSQLLKLKTWGTAIASGMKWRVEWNGTSANLGHQHALPNLVAGSHIELA